jgi:uncharacterized repeat protein (TIGR03803 family)
MSSFNWAKRACGIFLLWATAAVALPAQTYTVLHSSCSLTSCNDGAGPNALLQATNGDLYGTAYGGGVGFLGSGTVFRITLGGVLTPLFRFGEVDGANPVAPLIQASDGEFYGTTYKGGNRGFGTAFKIRPDGTGSDLYLFCLVEGCPDGSSPADALLQASDGNFYGTATSGGPEGLYGTVFKITPDGTLTTLHNFGGPYDGANPESALIEATDGDFYGTTPEGGAYSVGTVYRITPGGALTILHSFNIVHGDHPSAAVIQALDGDFYGTTSAGGKDGGGTAFKITRSGAFQLLYNFCTQGGPQCTDGGNPSGLIQATDGNFYGTTFTLGANNYGTIFQLTPDGTLTTLYAFCSQSNCTDGKNPTAALIQDTNGIFYGATPAGGTYDSGAIFSLSVGLGPFVKTQPTYGNVGSSIQILGTDLTGATSVTFNGTAAVFTVNSASLITTTVPAGATTGIIEVVTPAGTLNSNLNFRVLP